MTGTPQRTLVSTLACALPVCYFGKETISILKGEYDGFLEFDDSKYVPVSDEILQIAVVGTFTPIVDFVGGLLKPSITKSHGDTLIVRPDATEAMARLANSKRRGLNIPEGIEYGRRFPGDKIACLGQIVQLNGCSMFAYIIRRGLGLLPVHYPLEADCWSVPSTTSPDPLRH